MKEYSILRKQYLEEHPICEVCNIRKASDIHHKNKRFKGRLNEVEHWMATCRKCHQEIEDHKEWARENGYLK